MATLRELIAKVVFKADPAQLKAFSATLDATKTKLLGVDTNAKAAAKSVAATGSAAAGAQPGLGALWRTLGGLGAAALAYKALNWGKTLVAEADAVGELSAKLGITTDEVQTWSAFVERAGGSTEDLSTTVRTLAHNISTVAQTAKGPAAEGFKRLGISTAGWAKELPNTMDVLLAAGGALGELENDTERLALAQEVLGKSALAMMPAFKDGTKSASEQLDMLRDLAVVYDKEFIAQADAASDEMDLFGRQMKGVGVQIVLAVLPALRDFVRWLMPVVKGVRNVVHDSNAFRAVLGVLGGVGIGKLLSGFAKLMTRLGGFTNLLKAGGRIVLRFLLPFLILDDIITFLRGGKSVIGDILDAMFGMGAAKSVLEGIKGIWEGLSGIVKYFWGLMSGDQKAIDEGEAAILKFGAAIGDIGADFAEAWRYALRDIGAAFEGWASSLSVWLSGVWTSIVDGLAQMLATAVAKVKNFASDLPLIGGLFKSDSPADPAAAVAKNTEAGLALGGSPAVSQAKSTNVTVTDNSTITTNLNGVDAKNVGTALRQSERNISTSLERNKAQVLRQTVGAAGT